MEGHSIKSRLKGVVIMYRCNNKDTAEHLAKINKLLYGFSVLDHKSWYVGTKEQLVKIGVYETNTPSK